MKDQYCKDLYNQYVECSNKLTHTLSMFKDLKIHCEIVEKERNSFERKIREYQELVAEYEKEINVLKQKLEDQSLDSKKKTQLIEKLERKLNADGTNCGIPTSQTPINKKKVNPNSREKSNKTVGGQKGHDPHKLEKNDDCEIDEYIEHTIESCSTCGSNDLEIIKVIEKDEIEIIIKVVKRRHKFYVYKCKKCGKIIKSQIPLELKEANQYGSNIKSLIVFLNNVANVPYNKISTFFKGITNNEVTPSEGYMVKTVKNYANKLSPFMEETKDYLCQCKQLYWDDTVIYTDAERTCMRFYGDNQVAYYSAHKKKDKAGLDDDNILNNLTSDTVVMHDHNIINYNEEYSFQNIECNQHLLRDLERIIIDLPSRTWCKKMKCMIKMYIKERNELVENEIKGFDDNKIKEFFSKLDEYMYLGKMKNEKDNISFGTKEEKKLLKRIEKYQENYFKWIKDFELPITNNLSERALRCTKSKMKSAGQFKNIEMASKYAIIKSYLETCNKNFKNVFLALKAIGEGRIYSLDEVIKSN